jgi:hypothetical protein
MKMNKSLAADLQNIILAKYIIHVVMYYCLVYIYIFTNVVVCTVSLHGHVIVW